MRIILVEFPWQTKEIINNKESFKKHVVVSLGPESSYILKINKISYFETYQFCNHKEFSSDGKTISLFLFVNNFSWQVMMFDLKVTILNIA